MDCAAEAEPEEHMEAEGEALPEGEAEGDREPLLTVLPETCPEAERVAEPELLLHMDTVLVLVPVAEAQVEPVAV